MAKMQLIEQYTEENYSIDELGNIFKNKMRTAKMEGTYIEFVAQKPVYSESGKIIGITTDFPAELNVYKLTKQSDCIKQTAMACKLLNPLLPDSLPEDMNEKLAVFRNPVISQEIVFDSIEDIKRIKGDDKNA